MRIRTLTNGKKVANFSSPHPFIFEDGTVLPSVPAEESNRLKVTFLEMIDSDGDVMLDFELSDDVRAEMWAWSEKHKRGEVDVVFVPLPMLTAMKAADMNIKKTPFRAVRIQDRIKKLVSIHKQCL